MNVIPVPPNAQVLMEATRAIGYSIETAVADLIDNCVAASANKIDIHFFPIESPYIAILDNGYGMNESELINAMRYGSKSPLDERGNNDLGRFGLGLKTASLSQCRKLTVISKKDNLILGAQWDLDFIATTGDWSLKLLDEEDITIFPHVDTLIKYPSGTLVICQELDRLRLGEINFAENMGKYMDRVREHVSLVFHRYLDGEPGVKKIKIAINNIEIEPTDPFLTLKSSQIMADEVMNVDGQKVTIRPYILPHISQLTQSEINMLGGKDGLRKQQGFYVYRNKRLLVWGTWFRMIRQGDLSKLARIRVDIPNSLDHLWTLDIKKSIAVPPEIVRRNLAAFTEKIAERSKRTWTYRGRKEIDDSKVHVWNRLKTRQGGISYEINREYPLVTSISDIGTKEKFAIEQLIIQIERNLPLNQLFVDLTNDEKIINSNEISKTDLSPVIKQLIAGCRNAQEREELAKRLLLTEPFDQNPEWLSEIIREVEKTC